jgi:hypothetical protein
MNDCLDNSNFKLICNAITERLFPLGLEYDEPNINNLWEIDFKDNGTFILLSDECKNTSLRNKIFLIIDEVIRFYRT